MSNTRQKHYGLTKLMLLNTAGYAKCVIPLDRAASICAPNNTGKSSVINALQFPLINDLRLTEWDGHDLDDTRKFYFATDQSYILLEADLPHGKVVIGVAGLGKISGYAHQYFCYHGELDQAHYTMGKSIIKYTHLFNHLKAQGLAPFEIKARELNALLTGAATPFDADLNLKMIPLNNASDAPTYKEIFRRMLNLHNLGAQDVKKFMLKVFERHMSNTKVDFFDVWNQAFDKVNRAKRELRILESQQEAIAALESMLDNKSVLKGKIAAYAAKIDQTLVAWHDFVESSQDEFREKLNEVAEEKSLLEGKQSLFVDQLKEIARRKSELDRWIADFDVLQGKFELTNETTLQNNLAQIKSEYEALSHSLSGVKHQSIDTIRLRKQEMKKQLRSLQLQQTNLEYNLFTRLCEDISLNEVKALSKVLNPDLLSLSTAKNADIEITDESAFSDFVEMLASQFKQHKLVLPGATISLDKLTPATVRSTEDKVQLKEQIHALEHSLEELEQLEIVSLNMEEKTKEKESLYQELLSAESDISSFKRYQIMLEDKDTKLGLHEALEEEEQTLNASLEELQANIARIADQRNTLHAKQEQLKRQVERLEQVKSERLDDQIDYVSGKVTPYFMDINVEYDTLPETLHQYNRDCQELRNFDINIKNTYLHIYNAGITKYEAETDEDVKYQKLVSAYHHLDQERDAVEKQARVALTDVAATIKGLREDLERLKREMNSFNRGIWQHQISNLKSFKIEVIERKQLVSHIDQIIATSDLYENGDTFDLLSSEASKDESRVNEAKDYLITIAQEKGGLTLSDLFDIRFQVVNRNDETEYYEKIDSAGSNGTRITIKLLCGMLFIRHLMAEKERDIYRIPIYIDEAADIDPSNQQALIRMATSFGFIPIFASVKPQTSCDYIVPIRTVNAGAQNWVDEKDWIEVSRDEENQEESLATPEVA
ncbi:coiled-coil domain-containing protein [Algicola sagamiensis]|uniref:hypothetical protein n=1 Tax=Algicola sagamiensis TaxID=163869 RepID=UPI000360A50E|nr:hypothetical protein [Algicola sagamiensis]